MNTIRHKIYWLSVLLVGLCTVSVFCQDTTNTRSGLKGLSFGINFNPISIGNSSLSGKYWLNEQQVLLAGLGFTIYDNPVNYSVNGMPSTAASNYFSNLFLLAGTEYHFAKNQSLSPFVRATLSTYFGTVAGYNKSKIGDSGTIFLTPGFGLEYFITSRVSIGAIQSIDISYAWGVGIQSPNNPSVLLDSRLFRIQAASTSFLLNIYF